MRVVIGHGPLVLAAVIDAAREACRDAGGNPEIAEHQRHRAGEVLAIATVRLGDEGDERRQGRALRRRRVVGERSRPEPGLELERGGIRTRGVPHDPPCRAVEGLVGAGAVGGREDLSHPPLAIRRAERGRGHARFDIEIRLPDLLRVAGRQGGELPRRRLGPVAPDAVSVSARERPVLQVGDAAVAVIDGVRTWGVRDRHACSDQVAVAQRSDGDHLPNPPLRVVRGRRQLGVAPQFVAAVDPCRRDRGAVALVPVASVKLVQRGRPPVRRLARSLDRQDCRDLLRKMEAAEVRVPDVFHGHGFWRLRIEVPPLPVQNLAARDCGGSGRRERRQDDRTADERPHGKSPRLQRPTEADDEREHSSEQGDAAQQVVGTGQQGRRPARGHDHRSRGEHRLARGDRHRHGGAGGVEGNEDDAVHARVADRGEGQPDVVELEEAAAETAEQPDWMDDPDAERRVQRQDRCRDGRDRQPAGP